MHSSLNWKSATTIKAATARCSRARVVQQRRLKLPRNIQGLTMLLTFALVLVLVAIAPTRSCIAAGRMPHNSCSRSSLPMLAWAASNYASWSEESPGSPLSIGQVGLRPLQDRTNPSPLPYRPPTLHAYRQSCQRDARSSAAHKMIAPLDYDLRQSRLRLTIPSSQDNTKHNSCTALKNRKRICVRSFRFC